MAPASPDRQRALERLATATSRRGFLARVSEALVAVAGAGTAVRLAGADPAEAYTNFCGHLYTTGNCPHPTGLPRIDRQGRPLRARDGVRVDDLGRRVDDEGRPIDEDARLLTDPDGRPLPPVPRSRLCAAVGERYDFRPYVDGSWHRCCGGQVRSLVDCCGYVRRRINGDGALTGYCYRGRKVFCVMYRDTKIPC